jgi:murein DD-endopeptidase MepM/ murein hydrolase activator NlpD
MVATSLEVPSINMNVGWQRVRVGHLLRAAVLVPVCCSAALAQDVYRAVAPDGTPAYSDRPQSDSVAELSTGRAAPDSAAGVELFLRSQADGVALLVGNRYYGPAQIAVYASEADYLAGALPLNGLPVLPARTETELWRLPDAAEQAASQAYHLLHIPGDPRATHAPPRPYRLPYATASRHVVSQAYPERITHNDPSSEHAVDFEMPIGTGVYAAREGTVMEVAGDYYRSESDPSDGAPANLVRILHDDGTMAVYAHLSLHSIRVEPGRRVERGERLADSGDTGFSTGPHLHFVVQRNRGGAIVSVPVQFAAIDGSPVDVHSGEAPTAY